MLAEPVPLYFCHPRALHSPDVTDNVLLAFSNCFGSSNMINWLCYSCSVCMLISDSTLEALLCDSDSVQFLYFCLTFL